LFHLLQFPSSDTTTKLIESDFKSSDSALKGSMDIWVAKLDDEEVDELTGQS